MMEEVNTNKQVTLAALALCFMAYAAPSLGIGEYMEERYGDPASEITQTEMQIGLD